jgi:hypothetical protein
MSRGPSPVSFQAEEIERLLGLLDSRLRSRGVRASIYVVGGAAIAMTVVDTRRTVDIDAIVSQAAVMEEARLLADGEGIPTTWLNGNAGGWVPARPADAVALPDRLGLTVFYAPPEHLLAMKLIAARPQDGPDIIALSLALGLGERAEEYADLLERVYHGEDALESVMGGRIEDVRAEALSLGQMAVRLVQGAL